jgi:hypothetical protein
VPRPQGTDFDVGAFEVAESGANPIPTGEPTSEPIPGSISLTFDSPASVNLGETFNIDVIAQNLPTPGLYGVQFEINYDPTLISVNNLQINPNFSFEVRKNADNGNGQIRLATSQRGKVPGLTGDVVLLSFEATAANTPGEATFTFENEKFSDFQAQGFEVISEVYSVLIAEDATPEPTVEPTPEPTSEPTPQPTIANITGQTILPGRTGEDWSGATVTIEDNGQTATTNTNGEFTISDVTIDSRLSITADAPGYLSAVCADVAVIAPETALTPITLLSGDLNSDDLVDITDATMVGTSFSQTGPDMPADITRDELVDIFDIVLVSVNFGQTGPQNWECQSQL